ncbi:MAG TPA: TolC family protein, partial [Epsilonproteobacteria bacterium]|nr:TolC family protein [Campylobacterota bacterium]
MYIKKITFLFVITPLFLFAGLKHLSLQNAMKMLDKNNLELKISRFTEQMKAYEAKAAKGQNFGKLDLSISAMRSNDAGNVFGFKLQSREANFGDFGAEEFFANYQLAQGGNAQAGADLFTKPPSDLNYP